MSYEAEKAVIGCLLLDNDTLNEIYGYLTPAMFKDIYLAKIYGAMIKMHEEQITIDAITIKSRISDNIPEDILENLLISCVEDTPFSANIAQYAKIIIQEHEARILEVALKQTVVKPENIDDSIRNLSNALETLGESDGNSGMSISKAVQTFSKDRFTCSRPQGLALGYKTLDNKLGGLFGGDMCIIAARPSVGKSAFSTEIALNMARTGKRVCIFCLEMTKEQVYERMIAHESGIALGRIKRAVDFMSGEEEKLFNDGNRMLSSINDNIMIYDDIDKISKMTNRLKIDRADVAIIDYMQLIIPESMYRGNRVAEVGQISHSIKKSAKRLNIPIIVLAQLNRVSMSRENKEPDMSELREAGDIEQDADQIILIWNKDEKKITKCVKIDKNRQGVCGRVNLDFDGAVMRFREAEDEFYSMEDEETPFD